MSRPIAILLSCSLAGLIAATAVYVFVPPIYESRAKLLVRYIVARSPIDGVDDTVILTKRSKETDGIIATEVDIITSTELMRTVGEAIGAKRILAAAGNNNAVDATHVLRKGLNVSTPKGRNVIFASYRSRDPELAPMVLGELINHYFTRHIALHRSAGSFDFVTMQAERVQAQTKEIEKELQRLRSEVVDPSDAERKSDIEMQVLKLDEKLRANRARQSDHDKTLEQARIDELLDPSKIPNISVLQKPSAPVKITRARDKAVFAVAGAGVGLGIVLSLLSAWRSSRSGT